jgi:hypothetical protein
MHLQTCAMDIKAGELKIEKIQERIARLSAEDPDVLPPVEDRTDRIMASLEEKRSRFHALLNRAVENSSIDVLRQIGNEIFDERVAMDMQKYFYDKELRLSAELIHKKQQRIRALIAEVNQNAIEASLYHRLKSNHEKEVEKNAWLESLLKQQELDSEALRPEELDPANHWSLNDLSGFDPKMPVVRVFKTLKYRLHSAYLKISRLQKELEVKEKERADAVLDAVKSRQREKHVDLVRRSDIHGMEWARLRMERLDRERELFIEELNGTRQESRSIVASSKRAVEEAQAKLEVQEKTHALKVASMEMQLDTSRQHILELYGNVRRKELIISQLSNKLDLLKGNAAGSSKISKKSLTNSQCSSKDGNVTESPQRPATAMGSLDEYVDKRGDPFLKSFFAWKDMRKRRTGK